MFTGIIQAQGHVRRTEARGQDVRLTLATGKLDLSRARLGDSIAVNGCCLTAMALGADEFSADVSLESLRLTTLGGLNPGDPVNLEMALTLQTPLGGHLVSGHVDGVGRILSRYDEGRAVRFQVEAPSELARYIASKGSIAVDGVSLTVNVVEDQRFMLNLVPHTLQETIAARYRSGTRVNLEVDIVARYLERLLNQQGAAAHQGLTEDSLRRQGFIN